MQLSSRIWALLANAAHTGADGLDGGDSLNCSSSTQQVADHGLGAIDAHVTARNRCPDCPVFRQVTRLQAAQSPQKYILSRRAFGTASQQVLFTRFALPVKLPEASARQIQLQCLGYSSTLCLLDRCLETFVTGKSCGGSGIGLSRDALTSAHRRRCRVCIDIVHLFCCYACLLQ